MRKRKNRDAENSIISGYDFRTTESRVENAVNLFTKAKTARTVQEAEWIRYNDYYNFIHDASREIQEYCEENNIPRIPATCPDPWIMVESQINPIIPTPEFRGRDSDLDSAKAKQREFAVKYIIENNDIEHKNTGNERRLLKLGDGFWKGYWDITMRSGPNEGDIRVIDVGPEAIYPDPSVRSGDVQDCQYLAYIYKMHKVKFWQTYRKRLEELEKTGDEIESGSYVETGSIFDLSTAVDETQDTVQVMEFWFRWPEDGEIEMPDGKKVRVREGEVGCSIQAGDIELKLIPNYWKRTGRQCRMFPFVHYWRIRDENSFWNKSELYPIIDLVDAQDEKLASTLLNDMFLGNDMVVVEEGALADGEELTNAPGATIYTKAGRGNGVRRMGGLASAPNAIVLLNYLKEQIERTNRNYETNLGKETSRQTTATGLAMLREDAGNQNTIKESDRNAGFARLYELLDWLALEWYDDNRLLFLGANKEKGREEPEVMNFNSDQLSQMMPEVRDLLTGELVREQWRYWPKVDVTVTAGDGVLKGKNATMQALQTLANASVTPDNYKLYETMIDILDLPQKQEIKEEWEAKFASKIPQEILQAMEQDPKLLQTVMQFVAGGSAGAAPIGGAGGKFL